MREWIRGRQDRIVVEKSLIDDHHFFLPFFACCGAVASMASNVLLESTLWTGVLDALLEPATGIPSGVTGLPSGVTPGGRGSASSPRPMADTRRDEYDPAGDAVRRLEDPGGIRPGGGARLFN